MTGIAHRCDALLVEDLGQQRLPARTTLAVLKDAGFTARLLHMGRDSDPQGVVHAIRADQPRLIVLFVHFDHLLAEYLALARLLRAAGCCAHLTITGPLPALTAQAVLDACPALDSVLCTEAGAGVVELLRSLAHGAEPLAVPGLAHRRVPNHTGLEATPQPLDLDRLPAPVYEDLPTLPGTAWGYATLEASRGCYHACAFCLPCTFYRRAFPDSPYRARSISLVLEEIAHLYERGARLFMFDDEQFLAPPRTRAARVEEFTAGLASRGLRIAFTIKCRPDDVDESLFARLQRAGLVRVFIGIESGHDPTLALLGKRTCTVQNRRALAILRKLGIVADFRVLAFHPWTTVHTLTCEIAFLEEAIGDLTTPISFHDVVCYPGTPLDERLAQRNAGSQCSCRSNRGLITAYTINDRRAEVLRRLNRLVFGQRDAPDGLHTRISPAWYDILVRERMEGAHSVGDQRAALQSIVARLNCETLAIWREMLDWSQTSGLLLADAVNERAAALSQRARQSDLAALDALAEAGFMYP